MSPDGQIDNNNEIFSDSHGELNNKNELRKLNMKRIVKISELLLMCMLVIFSACTDAIVSSSSEGEGIEVPIALEIDNLFNSNPPTYGTDYPGTLADGNAAENLVDNIIVYIFDNLFNCERILEYTSATYMNPIGPVMVKSGIKHFVAVANSDGKLTLEKTTPSNVNYLNLLNEITNISSTLPASPFLMTGVSNYVNVPPDLSPTTPHAVTLPITRAVAKITMQITKDLKALNHSITLRTITMYRGANRVALFNTLSPDPTLHNINIIKNTFNPNGIVQDFPTYIYMADTIYTYENLCGADTSKAIRFEIETEVNTPSNIRTAKFYLATYEPTPPGDSIYNVYRNYWYDVKVRIVDPGMDSVYITINACPWNVADPIDTIVGVGAEFATALPLKLVKNFTYDEMILTRPTTPYTSWAAINSHSKGASWIDFKVTNGATWAFNVKDNTSRNQGVYYSLDSTTWTLFPVSGIGGATGLGNEDWKRIYIYRPYRENDEPPLGPSLYMTLNGIHKQDFIIQPRDTLPIPINCYILRPRLTGAPINETRVYIPLAGVFSHLEDELGDSVVYRSLVPIDAKVWWKDTIGDVVTNVSVIHPNNPDSAYIYAEAGVPGNAVITMHLTTPSTDPDIYWAFHVWVTEYNPYEAAGQNFYQTDGAVKNVFMDRNLGAMSNTWDADGNARGLFYQFGRKDPFPRGQFWSNAPTWKKYIEFNNSPQLVGTMSATSLLGMSNVFRPKHMLQETVNNPDIFITRIGSEDWPLSVQNPNLWISPKGNKTAYDPCPEGWRIPDVLEPYATGNFPWEGDVLGTGTNGFKNSINNGWYSLLVGYYPKSGYIYSPSATSAALINSGTQARVWTSCSVSTNLAMGLLINDPNLPEMNLALDKSWGANVRCVVDKNYIRNAENGGLFGTGITNLKNVLLP